MQEEASREATRRHAEAVKKLGLALHHRNLVIIVGAGVTVAATADSSGTPMPRVTWTGLIRNGLDYLVKEEYVEASNRRTAQAYDSLSQNNQSSLLDAANVMVDQMRQNRQFPTWLDSAFGSLSQEIRHPLILETLRALHEKGATLLTTNYDDLLEKACNLRRIGRSNKEDILRFKRQDLDGVLHVHGSYHDPDEIVLDSTGYYRITHEEEIQNILRTFLEYKTIVFVGCGSGLEDPNFSALLKWAGDRQEKIPNRHYLLIRDGDSLSHPMLIRLRYGPQYTDLAPFLQQLLTPAEVTTDLATRPAEAVTEEEAACIQSFPTFGDEYFFEGVPKPLPGTCKWIFHTPTYTSWVQSASPAILHICGKPGSGKSVLSSILYSSARDEQIWDFVSYFSFSGQDERRGSSDNAYMSLIGQILDQNPVLVKHILPKIQKRRAKAKPAASDARRQFEMLIQNLRQKKVLVILDALDECDESVKEFLRHLVQNSGINTQLKIIMLSRPQPNILAELKDALKINLDEEKGLGVDIALFIRSGVEQLIAGLPGLATMKDSIEQTLLQRSDGMFLLVRLILDDLQRLTPTTRRNVEKTLASLPLTLTKAYTRILESVPVKDHLWVKRALIWIVHATRPLRVNELRDAVALHAQVISAHDLIDNRQLCFESDLKTTLGPLLSIQNERVQLVHQTVKETLLCASTTRGRPQWFEMTTDEAQQTLLHACTLYMGIFLIGPPMKWGRRSLLQQAGTSLLRLPARKARINDSSYSRGDDDAPLLDYAVENFPEHARQLPESSALGQDLTVEFLRSGVSLSWEVRYWDSRDKRMPIQDPLRLACTLGLSTTVKKLAHPSNVASRDREFRALLDVAAETGIVEIVKSLLEQGADKKAIGKDGTTAIVTAAWFGHVDVVQLLLEPGAQVSTAIEAAAEAGHVAVVDYLLISGDTSLERHAAESRQESFLFSTPSDTTMFLRAALNAAVRFGQIEMVKHLLEWDYPATTQDARGRNLIHVAAGSGQITVIDLLMNEGCTVIDVDHEGRTPLHIAAQEGQAAAARSLIAKDANVNAKSESGESPAHMAASHGHAKVVQILLDHGYDVDQKGNEDQTILHAASTNEVRSLVLASGCKTEARDVQGRTAFDLAAEKGDLTALNFYIGQGASTSAIGHNCITLLHRAAKSYDARVTDFILSRGHININAQDSEGDSALHVAARFCHPSVVSTLTEKGANVNLRNRLGCTALHEACKSPFSWDSKTVELLSRNNACIDDTDNNNATPLQLAVEHARIENAQTLIIHGARLEKVLTMHNDQPPNPTIFWFAYDHGQHEALDVLLSNGSPLDEILAEGLERPLELTGYLTPIKKIVDKITPDEARRRMLPIISNKSVLKFHGQVSQIITLLDLRGKDLDHQNTSFGQTLLSMAAENGYITDVEELLERGAALEVEDKKGRTALWWAVREGKDDCVALLLEKGAKPKRQQQTEHQTPAKTILEIAQEMERHGIVELLTQYLSDDYEE